MGYKEIQIRIPVNANQEELEKVIRKKGKVREFSHTILRKSLDARNKRNIKWQYQIGISSPELSTGTAPENPLLKPIYQKRQERVLIAGSGPAGLFAALFLAESGFKVTLLERGGLVEHRREAIHNFESSGKFDPKNNYAFGEGGAGTFSDGKLTSRTKGISAERNFIFDTFIKHGAPDEIAYMTHPHLGTDNLFRITQNIRSRLQQLECTLHFNTQLDDLKVRNANICGVNTSIGVLEADYYIMATGHSSYETYKMLMRHGIPFHPKNFALGFRAEHSQECINVAQWGTPNLPGVKAAEYRLSATSPDDTPVYSFCMCPGGKVVPSTPYAHTNIVNGMSMYQRNSRWANAAIVAGINLENYLNKPLSASEALNWLENLENSFYEKASGYNAPAALISSFLNNTYGKKLPDSSYPFALQEMDYSEFLPHKLIPALSHALENFCRKLKGYESGVIMGLESKTSAPIQVERDKVKLNSKFDNLFIAGEGSGWSGGIISSAADGLKIVKQILISAR